MILKYRNTWRDLRPLLNPTVMKPKNGNGWQMCGKQNRHNKVIEYYSLYNCYWHWLYLSFWISMKLFWITQFLICLKPCEEAACATTQGNTSCSSLLLHSKWFLFADYPCFLYISIWNRTFRLAKSFGNLHTVYSRLKFTSGKNQISKLWEDILDFAVHKNIPAYSY